MAGFINPPGAAPALRHYRESFQPQGFGLDSPRAILTVNVTVGDTTAEGHHLVNSAKGYYARLSRAGRAAGSLTVPTPDDAAREMSPTEKDEPVSCRGPVAPVRRRRTRRHPRHAGADGRGERCRRARGPRPHR